jgi:hypothetical protein
MVILLVQVVVKNSKMFVPHVWSPREKLGAWQLKMWSTLCTCVASMLSRVAHTCWNSQKKKAHETSCPYIPCTCSVLNCSFSAASTIFSKSLLWYSSNPNSGLPIWCLVHNCVEPQWPACGFEGYRQVVSSSPWSKSCIGKHCLCHFLCWNSSRRILLVPFGSEIWANKFNYGDHTS